MVKKIVASILLNFYEEKKLLHKDQFGYKKQRNTIDAITKLILTTENVWNSRQQLGTLFMNVKETFDCVLKQQLLQKLIKLKILDFLIK